MFHGHFEISYPYQSGKFYIPEHADAIVDITLHNPQPELDRYIIELGYARMMVEKKFQWCLPYAIFRYRDGRFWKDLHLWDMPSYITVKYAYITGFRGLAISYGCDAVLGNVTDSRYEWNIGQLSQSGFAELCIKTSGTRVEYCSMEQGRVASVSHYPMFAHSKQKI